MNEKEINIQKAHEIVTAMGAGMVVTTDMDVVRAVGLDAEGKLIIFSLYKIVANPDSIRFLREVCLNEQAQNE